MIDAIAGAVAADARRLAATALAEDGPEDVTSLVAVPADHRATAEIEARGTGIFAGRAYADAVAAAAGAGPVHWRVRDGAFYTAGEVLGTLVAPLRQILRAERPLLNMLQRACGIATATRAYADAVAGTSCRVLHTRKTAPGLRLLDAEAVVAGGGHVHRLDLALAVMVKDNHWQALRAGGRTLHGALGDARARGVGALYVEVESVAQVEEACAAGATRLLIDNQDPATAAAWAALARGRRPGIEIEATGGITLANARAFAQAGMDFISIGALTHSVTAADLALEVRAAG